MNEKVIKELLEQVLANQAVLYKMLRKIENPNKSTPDAWLLDDLFKEAEKFKNSK